MRTAVTTRLEQLVLKSHVVLGLESDTGTEDVGESSTLLTKSVDNGSASRGQRSLVNVNFETLQHS